MILNRKVDFQTTLFTLYGYNVEDWRSFVKFEINS